MGGRRSVGDFFSSFQLRSRDLHVVFMPVVGGAAGAARLRIKGQCAAAKSTLASGRWSARPPPDRPADPGPLATPLAASHTVCALGAARFTRDHTRRKFDRDRVGPVKRLDAVRRLSTVEGTHVTYQLNFRCNGMGDEKSDARRNSFGCGPTWQGRRRQRRGRRTRGISIASLKVRRGRPTGVGDLRARAEGRSARS